jgi:hypothetical protein
MNPRSAPKREKNFIQAAKKGGIGVRPQGLAKKYGQGQERAPAFQKVTRYRNRTETPQVSASSGSAP